MTINCNGRLLDLTVPKVMGILNCTPNSFFDGGKYGSQNELLKQVEKMLAEGAAIIDIGAYSSQPQADFVSEAQELERLMTTLIMVRKHFPDAILSVDTFRAEVARISIENGADIINDIAAGKLDEKMLPVVGHYKVPYIMMHMQGTPQTMQQFTNYDDILHEMIYYFSERVASAREQGITDIIIDPGFGFSKTMEQNYHILNNLHLLKILELPVLSALSRKSMIYKMLNITPDMALNGTSVLNTVSLQNGAHLLRVHDVKEAVECIKLTRALYEN
ncbi:dihydropteroate synthase [Myroides ceti]|uniref:Dihydropteroate synthase n=1 Tax=Paenimyroides ceti TaxID=395087 RepID=A0ABT8CV81_9FLAO|nr:dihydropteroate synthase [Paenimyroides ceti]MDN3707558.1 dihydropteroate synthase [Paenimyroides ceti]